jgi:hypothetical protein
MKPFFIKIPNFRPWVDNFWDIWGIFGRLISIHFGTLSPLSMFSINQPLFQKKLNLHKYLGLGFEFEIWPQRIRDLEMVCL